MSRSAGRALAVVALLAAALPAASQPALSVHGTVDAGDPGARGLPRLDGPAPVVVGPSLLDVSAEDLLTVGLDETGDTATLSLWLDTDAATCAQILGGEFNPLPLVKA